jgi:protein-S-isoprenylcysteine O-methyltransferase Ste14
MKMFVLLLSVCSFLSITWAVYRFFSRPGGKLEPGMQLARILTICCFGMQLFDLHRAGAAPTARLGLASALYLTGLLLFWWAIRTHRARPPSLAYSLDAPEHLVQGGPYAMIRHPFYTAYMLFWSGGWMASLRWTSLVCALVMLVSYELSARLEERKFGASQLAEHYARYRARTGRYLPNPWKLWRAKVCPAGA